MSQQGIQIAARVFETMQQARQDLLRLGSEGTAVSTPSGHQDILLGQLLNKANDAIKDEFAELVAMDTRKK